MKAVVFHGIGDIRLDDVAEPKLEEAHRRHRAPHRQRHLRHRPAHDPRHHAGHEAGHHPRPRGRGRRRGGGRRTCATSAWAIASSSRSTIACGNCVYCRAGYYSQCDDANPNGPQAGTAFFGGPEASGPVPRPAGREGARARSPTWAWSSCPTRSRDDQAILLSDIFPTGYFGAELAEIKPGDTVAVFGCGPVGQFAIASAQADGRRAACSPSTAIADRLEMARAPGRGGHRLRRGGSGGDAHAAHRRHRRGPRHRRGGRGRRCTRTTGPRRQGRQGGGRRVQARAEGGRAQDEPGWRQLAARGRAVAGAASGRCRRWPRRARCPSSASTRRRRARSPSARR